MKKKKSFSVLIVLAVSFFIVSFVGMACTDELKASDEEHTGHDFPFIVEELAERLDLDPEEILEALEDIKEEKKEALEESFEEKLVEAVEEGDITEEQKEAIIKKREEITEEIQEIKDLPHSEKIEAIKDIASDLKEWAEDNDIELKGLFPHVHLRPIKVKRFGMKNIFKFFRK